MKSLGLIGGTSWHSTVDYYKVINQYVNDHFGNNTNPPLMIFTMNQSMMSKFQKTSQWDRIADMISDAAIRLENAGAAQLMICANTPHKVYEEVVERINTPILHIADAVADAVERRQLDKVGFIGTKYSMEEDFVTKRISRRGIDLLVPKDADIREGLQSIIEEELCFGKINDRSKVYVLKVIQKLIDQGAQGVVLGCTEFPLMISNNDLDVPVFNTSEIHALAGAQFILEDLPPN